MFSRIINAVFKDTSSVQRKKSLGSDSTSPQVLGAAVPYNESVVSVFMMTVDSNGEGSQVERSYRRDAVSSPTHTDHRLLSSPTLKFGNGGK